MHGDLNLRQHIFTATALFGAYQTLCGEEMNVWPEECMPTCFQIKDEIMKEDDDVSGCLLRFLEKRAKHVGWLAVSWHTYILLVCSTCSRWFPFLSVALSKWDDGMCTYCTAGAALSANWCCWFKWSPVVGLVHGSAVCSLVHIRQSSMESCCRLCGASEQK